ncbi:hypothetical protein DUI87_18699 [Hirundo rustica rustica]|uniref:Uncharacterized protein n=1 Tax=Hirundo rustica rustica TaxID=333673 RepID=A0A3M0JX01_HIRRU|nr:hypothetical protein DUI87_18699 [Hirundo rustica rustica]
MRNKQEEALAQSQRFDITGITQKPAGMSTVIEGSECMELTVGNGTVGGSKPQNCLWNTIIGWLTSNVKEWPKLTITSDPRPPEEILADQLLPVDSPEALVKTSFRSD